jgi:hypothetical protein
MFHRPGASGREAGVMGKVLPESYIEYVAATEMPSLGCVFAERTRKHVRD